MLSKNKLWLNQFYRPKEHFSLIERKKFPSFFSLALFSSFRKIFFNFYQQKNIFSFSLLSNNFFFSPTYFQPFQLMRFYEWLVKICVKLMPLINCRAYLLSINDLFHFRLPKLRTFAWKIIFFVGEAEAFCC